MLDWDLRRNTSSVHDLVGLARERGISARACLAGSSVTPEAAAAASAEITARQELRVVTNLVRECGEPGLGAIAGARTRLSAAGPWGLAMLSSPTVREMIEVARRYLDTTVVFGKLTFEESGDEARLRLDDAEAPAQVRAFLAERALAGFGPIGRDLFGAAIPMARVEFRHGAPPDTARHREIYGVTPLFDAEATVAVFDRRTVDRPLPRPSERARAACEQLCRDLLARHHARDGMAATVRDLLVREPGAIPDQIAVATALFMSPRTLSRRLNQEGTSFRALLDEVRQTLSEVLLTHTDMTTEQLAARLGYAEAASFIRAFRRWNDCPPQEYRTRACERSARPVGAN
ncbi:AraC family transcriptional regulator [Nocardia bovistercoris]|uniref:AraC family transcriptional regulator n=1 Tax=Nocardia bovistercoris TaxID=2785916 RepID=A0A931IFM8_9NOCA|nr:AraC family transcriptional regulator [Nocardia bovistercoris]MBH0780431.1 AraC family transcriptional regulator [Nocardia bovistercoris]